MALYIASAIMYRGMDYKAITTKYPQFKNDIDTILIGEGYTFDKDGNPVPPID